MDRSCLFAVVITATSYSAVAPIPLQAQVPRSGSDIATLSSPTDDAQQRAWTVEDVLALDRVGQVAISPDGRWAAYVVTELDLDDGTRNADVWIVSTEGGNPTRMTYDPASDQSPSWAPDGSWLAFLSSRDGTNQVYGIRPGGGEAWPVTDWTTGVQAYRVGPKGGHIAFTATAEPTEEDEALEERRGRPMVWDSAYATDWSRLWTAPLADMRAGTITALSPEGYSVGQFVWAPDEGQVAWAGRTMATDETFESRDRPTGIARQSDVYVQRLGESTERRVTSLPGSEAPRDWVEGLGLIVSGSGHALGTFNNRLWLAPTDGAGEPISLTDGIDEHAGLISASPNTLFLEVGHRTTRRLYALPLAAGRPAGDPELLSDDRAYYSGFSMSDDLERVAFLVEDPDSPANVHTSRVASFAPRKLTHVNDELASELAHGEQRVVRWRSRAGGEEIEGVLTLPVGHEEGTPVPLLLVIHGGPSGNSANRFNPGGRYPIQVFASLGYASLQPNYRGSTGYGERFRGLNRGDISGRDWVDVESGVDHLIAEGIADPDGLGIMGWSFGGHHTYWGITHTDRFKAASAGAGANALVSMYSQTDLPGFYHTYLGPKPWEDFDLYEERSAYRFVDRVTTPLLIQVGERDERVPAEQSIQFYEAVSAIGKAPAKLVIYPNEGHGIRDVALTRDVMERNVEWFTRWIPVSRRTAQGGNPEP